MGAGKTTAIRAISDSPPVSTEVANSEQELCAKVSTTVALDYGQLRLEDGTAVRLYGTPGQQRFAFMWEILCRGSLGVILLIDGSSASALQDFGTYVDLFRNVCPDRPFVIGVGRIEAGDWDTLDRYSSALDSRGIVAPVFGVDVRNRQDVLLLVETLIRLLEIRELETADAAL
jgi:signal recognition particle receptor subunit beta